MTARKKPPRIRVVVTAADIAEGTPTVSDACPIARALTRRFAKASVSEIKIGYESGGRWVWCKTPANARAFIRAFDHRRSVGPTAFYLEVG